MNRYIVTLGGIRPPESVGSKALNLYRLRRKKINIPLTHVCTWDAFENFYNGKEGVLDQLRRELQDLIRPGCLYAVRSSADVEDQPKHSYAGQFTSLLNVAGADAVLEAIQGVWSAAQAELVRSYQSHSASNQPTLRMAVIIQEMVPPVYSGVSFSRNPVTARDEVVVEAVHGDGSQLLQAGVTPLRWIWRWGAYLEKPDDESLPGGMIDEVIAQTVKIASVFKKDVDLEWVYDGQSVFWVQLRDITALHSRDIYSNRISREMLPGLIKPLVWSISTPIHSRQWVKILDELVGKTSIDPLRLVRAFHYRAYFNMGVFGDVFERIGMPRDSLEIMMGMVPKGGKRPKFMPGIGIVRRLPHVLRFFFKLLRLSPQAEMTYAELVKQAYAYELDVSPASDPKKLMQRVIQIVELQNRISYYTILCILLMQIYNGLLRSRLKAIGVEPERFNLTDGWEALQRFDPNIHIAQLNAELLKLPPEVQQELHRGDVSVLNNRPELRDFSRLFEKFLQQFGHLSDSTVDFTSVPWRETPELILKLVCEYTPPASSKTPKIQLDDLRKVGLGYKILEFFYHRARQFRLHRERFSGLYTYSLLLLRVNIRALGINLVERGLLRHWQDVFYLYLPELWEWIEGNSDGGELARLAEKRQEEMRCSRDVTLPEVIYGDQNPLVHSLESRKLCGIPTSGGYYSGPIKVIRGLSDFSKLQPGDVLVIPFSDVGWTPLFTRAGAVIAESGGILSHSSIVAREYGIPAVVSVAGAMELEDGTWVDVDGYQGEIYVKQAEPE